MTKGDEMLKIHFRLSKLKKKGRGKMKKKRLPALLFCLLLLCGTLQLSAFAQEPGEEVTAHINLPTTMKIGDAIGYPIHAPEEYGVYFEGLRPNTWVNVNVDFYSDSECRWFTTHAGETGTAVLTDENGTAVCYGMFSVLSFCKPGKFIINPSYSYYIGEEIEEGGYPSYGEDNWDVWHELSPIVIDMEEPQIETNLPQTIEVGASLNLQAELTGTSIKNSGTAFYLNPDNYYDYGGKLQTLKDDGDDYALLAHTPAYLPSLEILEGKELIERENADDSKTLTYQETLKFTKPGTVILKIKYEMFNTCNACLKDFFPMVWEGDRVPEDITYNPEKIFTIQVTEKEIPSSSQPSESSSQPSSQTSSQLTPPTSNNPEQSESNSSQLTNSSQSSSNVPLQNENTNSASSIPAPATGGNSFILPMIFILIFSLIFVIALVYKGNRKKAA